MQKNIATEPKRQSNDLLLTIAYAHSHINSKIHNILKPYNISSEQLNVLRALSEYPEKVMNMGEIQKVMFAKTSNTTRLVDKLVLKGFVDRNPCRYNKRIIEVEISDKGLHFLNNIDKIITKVKNELTATLTEHDKETLAQILEKIQKA
ncbi:MAG: MarR family transcriptional regulator [Bacteroidota bacterium]|nr:MarR family transcriptional regulator [Bacteroidota bacterium]